VSYAGFVTALTGVPYFETAFNRNAIEDSQIACCFCMAARLNLFDFRT
jgi:hypothetical protein